MVRIRQVEVRHTAGIADYRPFDGPNCTVSDILQLAKDVAPRLRSRKLWMLSAAATVGGVAEMMPRLCSLLTAAGVDTRWLVMEADDPKFFAAVKAIQKMLYGVPGGVPMTDVASVYAATVRQAAHALRAFVSHDDILVVHDVQTAGVPRFLPEEQRPRLIGRSHLGASQRTSVVREVWRFLAPYLAPYERLLFSSESYVPDVLVDRSGELTPSIDPLSHKNRELRPYKLNGILRSAHLAPGPPAPEWARFNTHAHRFVDGQWLDSPIDHMLFQPLITQIARFDRLKGFEYLIPAFVRMLEDAANALSRMRVDSVRAMAEIGCAQLLLAGPDPAEGGHDPEEPEVLQDLCAMQAKLPPELRERVHILRLPVSNGRQNALIVNALQRQSTVVVQNSIQEGFGLSVTEALWKRVPVVASGVGGLALQIRDGIDGLLVRDPTDSNGLAAAMLQMLVFPKQAEKMARSGRQRVFDHFLITRQIRTWLDELKRLLARPHPAEIHSSPPRADQAGSTPAST